MYPNHAQAKTPLLLIEMNDDKRYLVEIATLPGPEDEYFSPLLTTDTLSQAKREAVLEVATNRQIAQARVIDRYVDEIVYWVNEIYEKGVV